MKINILGTPYRVRRVKNGQDEFMDKMNYGGYCDGGSHEIVILDLHTVPDWENEPAEKRAAEERRTLRHEIVHAFLNESGLSYNSFAPDGAWAKNEEMVDWMALQGPKIIKAWTEAGCMEV